MDLVGWVGSFKSFTTYLARESGWRGRLWQPSFHDRLVRHDGEFRQLSHTCA
jgi:hypothetical protein